LASLEVDTDTLHRDLLGHPTDLQLREMQIQTGLYLEVGGGSISTEVRAALDAGETYLGRTAEARLSEIALDVEYWNWVSERVYGLRAEFFGRLRTVAIVQDILAEVAWFNSQIAAIVTEAGARVPT
jgi:hypothetical protein